jgi:hypothetical protein
VLGDHQWHVLVEGSYRGCGSASVHVRVHQVEPSSLNELSEFPGEGEAKAPLDQPAEQHSNRYARLLERTGELTAHRTSHGDLVPLSVERNRQVDYMVLGTSKVKRVDNEQDPKVLFRLCDRR